MDTGRNLSRRKRHAYGAGIIAWALVGVPVAIAVLNNPAVLERAVVQGWIAAYVCFGVAYWLSSWGWRTGWDDRWRRGLVIVQAVTAVVANALIPMPIGGVAIGGVLMVISAARAADTLSVRGTVILVIAQTAGTLAAYRYHWPWGPAAAATAAYWAFQLFAAMAGLMTKSEERARREATSALASLRATQEMLAQNAAIAERARIDQELHDVLGHHLVVLSLNLQTAAGMCEGRAAELVRGAHGLTRLILSDLRSMVREHRELAGIDLRGAVARLAAAAPGVRVEASVCEDVEPLEPVVAHAVFRCVQEFLTNTLKHAGASRAGVSIARDNGAVRLEAWDNGRGSGEPVENTGGQGLVGMRERVEALGGYLEVVTAPGEGFKLLAVIPSERMGIEKGGAA